MSYLSNIQIYLHHCYSIYEEVFSVKPKWINYYYNYYVLCLFSYFPPGTSALSTTIDITGTGFDTDKTKNAVSIGGVACTVTASTATSITCNVGNGPVGQYKVMVTVEGKGNAKHSSGDVMFGYTADISGISPTTGSLGGAFNMFILVFSEVEWEGAGIVSM